MDIRFDGKKALVTGAGRGIGRALTKRLVHFGCHVVALSQTQANLYTLKTELPSIETICVDVKDWTATKKAVEAIGHVDYLVNNAGVALCTPFGSIPEEELDTLFAINVKSIVNISQIVVEFMKEKGTGGSIVNLSSQAGSLALGNHLSYGASKAAVDLLTKTMALELGPYKIRVNSVNPTVVLTEMGQVGWSDHHKAEEMKKKIPLHRFCEPEEIVDAIVYLLSDKASMVNGHIMRVDGGATV